MHISANFEPRGKRLNSQRFVNFVRVVGDVTLDHERHLADVRDVLRRIAVGENQISTPSLRDDASIIKYARVLRPVEGCDLQCLGRRHACLHVELKLTMQGESREIVGPRDQWNSSAVHAAREFDHLGERFLVARGGFVVRIGGWLLLRKAFRDKLAMERALAQTDLDWIAIRPGFLTDGDPTQNISDIRKVALVIKGNVAYYPDEIHETLGVKPFTARLEIR